MMKKFAKILVTRTKSTFFSILMSRPKKVRCNVCNWEGRRFLSDSWHQNINCPKCESGMRQRLFFASLQNTVEFSFDRIVHDKSILHFAPEEVISKRFGKNSSKYATADFLRRDCDFKVDMSNMPEIANESFDTVLAFDVLEHIPDYQKALREVRRVLAPNGIAVFTVPQKDNLPRTYEDPGILTPEDRTKHYGVPDHLRIFGDDFPEIVGKNGFDVIAVDATKFSRSVIEKNILIPPVLSKNPLATNFRKVFFCQKRV